MELIAGTCLQGNKYRIVRTLGRGGFGITYLAEQVMARRKVCIKEFFPKSYYVREEDTGTLVLSSNGFAEMINRYKEKFIKEAQTIAALDQQNIIHIFDVFEENGTAYYVMEYIDGESLGDLVKREGAFTEDRAIAYLRQVAAALDYIHNRQITHLDVKPGNIMLRRDDSRAILIDFGLSKHYDAKSGEATSTTPVGVSHGFAPMEQYKDGGVSSFSPETDIYSLGATLYYLVTGKVPPQAADIADEGIPELPAHLSAGVRNAIERSMVVKRKYRPHSIDEFLALFNVSADETIPLTPEDVVESKDVVTPPEKNTRPQKKSRVWLWFVLLVLGLLSGFFIWRGLQADIYVSEVRQKDSSASDYTVSVGGVSFKMVRVDGGWFDMGSNDFPYSKPVHSVSLDGYWIGETEVTQGLWRAVMGTDEGWTNSYGLGDNYPAYYVNYNEAVAFCKKLNELTGNKYGFRLPTEAEWEFAARGGNKSRNYRYSGSNNIDNVAWYGGNSGSKTHPVKSKESNGRNELGLYDMSGNVWEWCYDWYSSSYYSRSPQRNPQGPTESDYGDRVLRGGGWSRSESDCRVAFRFNFDPDFSFYNSGFRVVASSSLGEDGSLQ